MSSPGVGMYRDVDGVLNITGREPAFIPSQDHVEEMRRRAAGIYPTSSNGASQSRGERTDATVGWFELSSLGRKVEIRPFDSTEIMYQDVLHVTREVFNDLMFSMAPETHPDRFDDINMPFLQKHLAPNGSFDPKTVTLRDLKDALARNDVFEMIHPCRATVDSMTHVAMLSRTDASKAVIHDAITRIKLVWKAGIGAQHRIALDTFCADHLRNPPLLRAQQSNPNGVYHLVPIGQPETLHFVYSSSKQTSTYQPVSINLVLKFQIVFATNGHIIPFKPPRKVVLNLHLIPLESRPTVSSIDGLWDEMLLAARAMAQDRLLADASLIETVLAASAHKLEAFADARASEDEEAGHDSDYE